MTAMITKCSNSNTYYYFIVYLAWNICIQKTGQYRKCPRAFPFWETTCLQIAIGSTPSCFPTVGFLWDRLSSWDVQDWRFWWWQIVACVAGESGSCSTFPTKHSWYIIASCSFLCCLQNWDRRRPQRSAKKPSAKRFATKQSSLEGDKRWPRGIASYCSFCLERCVFWPKCPTSFGAYGDATNWWSTRMRWCRIHLFAQIVERSFTRRGVISTLWMERGVGIWKHMESSDSSATIAIKLIGAGGRARTSGEGIRP